MNSAGIASLTQLPPSPELKGGVNPLVAPPPIAAFSLSADSLQQQQQPTSRLRSIARYASFHPQALACSPPLLPTTSFADVAESTISAPQQQQKSAGAAPTTPLADRGTTSLGAIAGSQGVALFRMSRPHAPLLIFSHASDTSNAKGRGVTSLSFQPECFSRNHLLALARGSGVLVYDVSGHSLSPLCGRLGFEFGPGISDADSHITSLAWQPRPDSSTFLAATTSSAACLWDLREPAGTPYFKPSLRFGVTARKSTAGAVVPSSVVSPYYVQVACSKHDQCAAILDAGGTLRIFDTRITDRTNTDVGALCSFSCFGHAGVGLAYLPSTKGETCWVTWGLDGRNTDAVVKVWRGGAGGGNSDQSGGAEQDYWYMDGSVERSSFEQSTSSATTNRGCALLGQCSTQNLACARVCPAPVENSILTVGMDPPDQDGRTNWRAELYKIKINDAHHHESEIEKIVSFDGVSDTDNSFTSMLGGDSCLGPLRGSEVALSTFPGTLVQQDGATRVASAGDDPDNEFGVLLCSLTDSGYITTHAIPEALPRDVVQKEGKSFSPASDGARASLSGQPRVFPDDREAALSDAARTLIKQGENPLAGGETRSNKEIPELPQASSDGGMDRTMPFELDVPVAYSIASGNIAAVQISGVNDMVPTSAGPAGIGAPEENEQQTGTDEKAAAAALMQSIETDRIPCPRICSATLCGGRLVTFNNGDVRKIWNWYQRTDSTRISSMPGLLGSMSDVVPTDDRSSAQAVPVSRDSPRTLRDLMDMTNAAKEAQWGDQDNSEVSSTAFPALAGDGFFDVDSDGSSESGEEEAVECVLATDTTQDSKGIYEQYFGDLRKPVADITSSNDSADQPERSGAGRMTPSQTVVMPSSDTLAPVVKIVREYDRLALSNQIVNLAEGWRLGGRLDPNPADVESDVESILGVAPKNPRDRFDGVPSATVMPQVHRMNVAPSRFLIPPKSNALTRLGSDPILKSGSRAVSSPTKSKALQRLNFDPILKNGPRGASLYGGDDERGVHNGEYSVRPNMQESMVFLKKLFTHQQETNAPNLFSPPDSPMLPQNLCVTPALMHPTSPEKDGTPQAGIGGAEPMTLGVYTLRANESNSNSADMIALSEIKQVCLHNATVCSSVGEHEKKEVWELLAQIVDSRSVDSGDEFDGWGSVGLGAMGNILIDNFLQYYELLGDVQMLSTMVCVLRRGQRSHYGSLRTKLSFLSPGQDEKYDAFIRRYSDLLYSWGLLTIRTELNKHVVNVLPHSEGESKERKGEGRTPGVALVFTCPRCGNETEFGTNYCRSCRDYAFRCAICDNAVRGLFSVCYSCGHGGHVGHLQEWFKSQNECPSGCGCRCTFASLAADGGPPRPDDQNGYIRQGSQLAQS